MIINVEEAMDQAEHSESGRTSDESDIESEHEDQPSSKRKFQGSATYSMNYDSRLRQQYSCIDGVKGDIYSFFCSTCSK